MNNNFKHSRSHSDIILAFSESSQDKILSVTPDNNKLINSLAILNLQIKFSSLYSHRL